MKTLLTKKNLLRWSGDFKSELFNQKGPAKHCHKAVDGLVATEVAQL